MSEQEYLVIAQNFYNAINNGDLDGLIGCFTEEIDWYGLALEDGISAKRIQGKSNLIEYFELSMNKLKRHWQPKSFLREASQVVVTGHGQYEAVETGFTFENEWVHILTFKDGKIDEVKTYIDPLTLLSLAH